MIQVISILQLIRRDDIRDGLVKIFNCLMSTPFLSRSSRTKRIKHVQTSLFNSAILVMEMR